ncbi:MAG: hypothetical protein ACPG31_01145 [Planctomycetota bacterium]
MRKTTFIVLGACLLLGFGCAKPKLEIEFADVTLLEQSLPVNLNAEENLDQDIARLFSLLHDEFFGYLGPDPWLHNHYVEGTEAVDEDSDYTWIDGKQWQDLSPAVHSAWEATLQWHQNYKVTPERRMIGGFEAFASALSWTHEEIELFLQVAEDKEEVLMVFAHFNQVQWEEWSFLGADRVVSNFWKYLDDSPYFTDAQRDAARLAYPLDREVSLFRTRLALIEVIRSIENGDHEDNPDGLSRLEQKRISAESKRIVEILGGEYPFSDAEVLYLQSSFLFRRVNNHSYFLLEETNLPWATSSVFEE